MAATCRSLIASNKGLGIMEVIVAAGIMAVVAMGTATMIFQMNKSASQTQAKMGAVTLNQDLRTQLQVNAVCSNSLKVPADINNPTTATTQPVQVMLGPTTITEGAQLPDYGNITVTDLKLQKFKLEGTEPTSNNKIYSADLLLGAKVGTFTFKPENAIRLLLTTSPTGTFISCMSGETAANCTSMGGTYNASGTPICKIPDDVASMCANMGGAYTATANPPCKIGVTAAPPPAPVTRMCSSTGAGCCTAAETASCTTKVRTEIIVPATPRRCETRGGSPNSGGGGTVCYPGRPAQTQDFTDYTCLCTSK